MDELYETYKDLNLPPCQCAVCGIIYNLGWVGSTPCCGAIAYGLVLEEKQFELINS